MPLPIALVTGESLASLHELETVYCLEDLYDMVEVIRVKRYNEWAAHDNAERERKNK